RSSSPAAGSGRSDRCALRRRLGRSERPRERRTWTWRRCSSTSRMRRRAVGVVERLKPWGLVNNAGSSFSGAIEDVGDAEARVALDTMVLAPMRYVPGTRLYGAVAGEAGIDLQGVEPGREIIVDSLTRKLTTLDE